MPLYRNVGEISDLGIISPIRTSWADYVKSKNYLLNNNGHVHRKIHRFIMKEPSKLNIITRDELSESPVPKLVLWNIASM